ncbi:MAG: sigma 54-interacting transcriptional regulator, partial [Deltaproteobacteria bacterium]|nr:sigma 54-interacting transcriptional regulator [Deltaproteobacteria bacterium]
IADGVFTVDRDRNITFFNRAAEKIIGVSRDQAVGQKCFDVFRANICQTACALQKTIETGEELINLHINILNSQGSTVPVSVSTSVLRDENGEIVGGVETFRDLSAFEVLRKAVCSLYTFGDIISKNHEVRGILDILPDIAVSGSTVLIEGPSGSGKELFARAIHDLSGRKGKYVALNCTALPDTLLESELFGYVKGAFTEAKKDKPGRFKLAEGGTILLDEIGDISTALQMKLLRVLQEKEYEPLGATATVKADVRIITSTNRTLSKLVARGSFREDLFYRLNVVRLTLPPLSRRREDIPLLLEYFIQRFNAIKGKDIAGVSEEALKMLMRYDFPGNVRELENFIEYAFVLCHGPVIEMQHLPEELLGSESGKEVTGTKPDGSPLDQAETRAILEALREHGGNRRKTAAHLGINKTTLWRKMKKYRITYHPADDTLPS